MKIEKVNDNQIRCTLTKSDLADRELKLSELAYGTEKAKNLFRDMMQQAAYEFGFEADDIPLMIEAIPLNAECIVLIITKVDDPEELDTRFSRFAPSVHDEEADNSEDLLAKGADDVLDLFRRIQEGRIEKEKANATASQSQAPDKEAEAAKAAVEKATEPAPDVDVTRIFSFSSLHGVVRLAHVLNRFYQGVNSLYKNEQDGKYMLVISKTEHTPEEFNKICNILSEYATPERFVAAGEAYLEEHFEQLVKDNAIQSLSQV